MELVTANTNCLVGSHTIMALLVRVCEDGLYAFAKVLLEKGANVGVVSCNEYRYGLNIVVTKTRFSSLFISLTTILDLWMTFRC